MGFTTNFFSLLVAALAVAPAVALTPAEWRSQSIYQVMTDRFARTDLSTTATCVSSEGIYCGGTWQGLISKLDYIQDMGFTAVWISPYVAQMSGDTSDGESYHVSLVFPFCNEMSPRSWLYYPMPYALSITRVGWIKC